MKRLLFAGVGAAALLGLIGQAGAADLRVPPRQAPYIPPPAVYNWTGFYIGVNGGGGWSSADFGTGSSQTGSGGLVGGTVGYNWQFGPTVLGLEADLDWSNLSTDSTSCYFGCQVKNDYLGTVRGRAGYAFDRFLPYITGGLAYGDVKLSTPFISTSDTNAGWTLGGGVEVGLVGNWTGKVEYLHVDLGNVGCNSCLLGGISTDYRADIVRGGINYRF